MQNSPSQLPSELAYKAIYPAPKVAFLCFLIAYLAIAVLLLALAEPFIPILFGIAVTTILSVYLTKLTLKLLDIRRARRSEKYDLPYTKGIFNDAKLAGGLTIILFPLLLLAFLKFTSFFI
jgi:hypothetical protein